MSQFLKKFLRENEGIFSRKRKPAIYLGAYGKHPGWDDHIDDIGLETESLLLAKQVLYVDGIGGQIDSGEWDKLHENQRLAEFKHIILWKRGNAFLLGRIWSSRDGKNRTKYPMIACTHCVSVPLPWGLTNVLPALEEVERLCKSTSSAEEVREIIRRTLAALRKSLGSASASQSNGKKVALIDQLGLADQPEKLFRITYHVCTRLGDCSPNASREDGQRGDFRSGSPAGSERACFANAGVLDPISGVPIRHWRSDFAGAARRAAVAGCDDWRTHHPGVLLVTSDS